MAGTIGTTRKPIAARVEDPDDMKRRLFETVTGNTEYGEVRSLAVSLGLIAAADDHALCRQHADALEELAEQHAGTPLGTTFLMLGIVLSVAEDSRIDAGRKKAVRLYALGERPRAALAVLFDQATKDLPTLAERLGIDAEAALALSEEMGGHGLIEIWADFGMSRQEGSHRLTIFGRQVAVEHMLPP